ncbi:MAG: MFS transporter [Bacilli bacterium]|nr:MFS transporter [Bacilli bacterium]
MIKITKKSSVILLVLICGFVYFTAYFTRKSLAITSANIIETTNLTKNDLGLAFTGLFISYGVMQIFSGIISDKTNPKYLIFIALLVSSFLNLGIYFTTNTYIIFALWILNGVAQAFIWPPMVRFVAYYLEDNNYNSGIGVVTSSGYLGQCILCVISALFCKYVGYKYLFIFSFAFGVFVSVLWLFYTLKFEYELPLKRDKNNEEKLVVNTENLAKPHLFFSIIFIFMLISVVMQGALRDGIESWTPTYISTSFSLDSSTAIMASMILPLLSFLAVQTMTILYKTKVKHPLKLAIITLFMTLGFLVLLSIFNKFNNAIIVIILLSLAYGSIAGTNHVFSSFMPLYFKDTGKISTVAGVLNATVYGGSALSGYGFALITTKYGWDIGIYIWIACAIIGVSCIFLIYKKWSETYLLKVSK